MKIILALFILISPLVSKADICPEIMANLSYDGAIEKVGDYAPIVHRGKMVTAAEVAKENKTAVEILESFGVKLEKSNFEGYLQNLIAEKKIVSDTDKIENGVYFVTFAPADGEPHSYTSALSHPEINDYGKKLNVMGFRLAIDTSLNFTGAGAYFSRTKKIVALGPMSIWRAFLHEFQHAQFSYTFDEGSIWQDTVNLATHRIQPPVEWFLRVFNSYSQDDVDLIVEMIRQGHDRDAINETLSVNREIDSAEPFMIGLNKTSRRYAVRHQITDLMEKKKKGSLTQRPGTLEPNEELTLQRLIEEYDRDIAADPSDF